MEETKKHLDELVATQAQKRDELRAIGREIASSATPIVERSSTWQNRRK
jgi:hypothetical protein